MSRIVEKAFNATQRIIRAVFMGRPNLFTTSDLNRQIEAFKYQLDQLDDKVGVLTDMTLDVGYDEDTNTILALPTFTYLRNKGVEFAGLSGLVSGQQLTRPNVTDGRYYLCVVATTGRVTDGDDPSHEISGAKFEDNTSKPAAEHYIVRTANFYIYTAAQVEAAEAVSGNIVFILANFLISDDTLKLVRYYVTDIKESAISLSQESINIANDAVAKADAAREVADNATEVCKETATNVSNEICQAAIDEATHISNEAKQLAQDAKDTADHSDEVSAQALEDSAKYFPIGAIMMWGGSVDSIPEKFHLCDGASISLAEHPGLAAAGYEVTGSNVRLPDLRCRFIVGYDALNSQQESSHSVDSDYASIRGTGGIKKVTLQPGEVAIRSHSHTATSTIKPNSQGKYGGEHKHKWFGDDQMATFVQAIGGETVQAMDGYDASSDLSGENKSKIYNTAPNGDHTHTIETTVANATEANAALAHENRPPYYVLAYLIRVK